MLRTAADGIYGIDAERRIRRTASRHLGVHRDSAVLDVAEELKLPLLEHRTQGSLHIFMELLAGKSIRHRLSVGGRRYWG